MSVIEAKTRAVLDLARLYAYDATHAHQVECIAGTLFIALESLHQLDKEERKLLEYAAVLHDIGYFVTDRGHHRHALQMIMLEPMPAFTREEKTVIANIARYHRKALPCIDHTAYAILNPNARQKVNKLAALLRVADALDHSHHSRVQELSCEIKEDRVLLHIVADGDMTAEGISLKKRAEMFRQNYGRDIELQVRVIKPIETATPQGIVA